MTRKFFLGCSLLALLAAGFLTYKFVYRSAPIRVESRDYGAHVDLHFLGEYCIGVRDLQIVDTTSGKTVWRVRDPEDTGICELDLRAGDNDVRVGQHPESAFLIVVPEAPTFRLSRGVPYEIVVTGNNGTGRYTTGRVRFQL